MRDIAGKPISARSARIMFPLGALIASGFSAFGCASQERGSSARSRWDYGLSRTPPYVPKWTRPTSVEAGKANGSIPASALAFETGNDGKEFESLTAWIRACNMADVAGAIETPVTTDALERSYIYRGLYGAGKENVRIKWTGRTGATRHCWLHSHLEDIVIRGIDFDSFSCVVGTTFPALALTSDASGKIDPEPYHTSSEPVYKSLDARQGGAAFGFHCRRLGRIRTRGTFAIHSVQVRRQVARSTLKANKQNGGYFDDLIWASVLETVPLFLDQPCASNKELVAAVNAASARTGYSAELSGGGDVFLVPVDHLTQAAVEILIEGTGAFSSDVQTPAVDISHCTFTDTDLCHGAILDVAELGPVTFCKNDLPGSWGGVGAFVTRWSEIRFANNHWRDCSADRPPAKGRKSSQLPAGSSLTAYNTACLMGTNSSVMMRYHARGNIALVENNQVDNVESLNATDTVNCAVLADVRNGWQVTSASRIIRFAYNRVKHLVGLTGAQDCNVLYGKLRGFSILANYFEDFGAAFHKQGANSEGSEAAALLFKNPGPYNLPYRNTAAEPAIIRGNVFVDGPEGSPWIKVDELAAELFIEGNLFRNWANIRGGAEVTTGRSAGLLRFTTHQWGAKINGNRFENISVNSSPRFFLINFWNLSPYGRAFNFSRFQFANNALFNEGSARYPELHQDVAVVNFQFNSGNPQEADQAFSQISTGHNRILSASGSATGARMRLYHDNAKQSHPGSSSAPELDWSPTDFLRSYGYAG